MRLKKIQWKNLLSYGNKIHTFEFSSEPELILVEGENGSGKCLSKNTQIEISIEDQSVREQFIAFLQVNNRLPKPLSPLDK